MLPDLSNKIIKIAIKSVLPKEGSKHDQDFNGGLMRGRAEKETPGEIWGADCHIGLSNGYNVTQGSKGLVCLTGWLNCSFSVLSGCVGILVGPQEGTLN